MSAVLDIAKLKIHCKGRTIVRDASFSIPAKTVTSIVGPSGAGKTTLLRSINRLLDEDGAFEVTGDMVLGQESMNGVSKYELRRRIGLVFQKPTIFPTSIFKNVIFGVKHTDPRPRREYPALVERCLREAFLWEEVKDRLHEPALELSIGQQQRLAIARTLAIDPQILLMDEPTASLDPHAAEQIEQLIVKLKDNTSVIVVTHDLDQARQISDQVVVLRPTPEGAVTHLISGRHEIAEGVW